MQRKMRRKEQIKNRKRERKSGRGRRMEQGSLYGIHTTCKASLGYTVRTCLKTK